MIEVGQDEYSDDAPKLTQAVLAEALGCAQSNVAKLKAQGMPTHSVEAAVAWRAEKINIAASQIAAPEEASGAEGQEGFAEARRRREVAEADLAEIARAKELGLLVEQSTVRAAFSKLAASAQQAMTQMAPRLAPLVAAETSLHAVTELIDAEVRQVLEQIVRSCEP